MARTASDYARGSSPRRSFERDDARAENATTLAVLSEDDEPKSVPLPGPIELDAGLRREGPLADGARASKRTHDAPMLERAPGVFTPRHVGAQAVLHDREKDVRRARGGVDAETEGPSGTIDRNRDLGALGRALDRALGTLVITAHDLADSIDDELRSVDIPSPERARVVALSRRERFGRERVPPAESIPVVHVLFERNDEDPRNWLLGVEATQDRVGSGAARSPLGGEEFHENGSGGSA